MQKITRKNHLPIILTVTCSLTPLYSYAGGHDRVADDGMIEAVTESGIAASAVRKAYPHAGQASIVQQTLSEAGVEVFNQQGGTQLSQQELARLTALPDPGVDTGEPVKQQPATEIILGMDTRERTYTTDYPARAKVLITFNVGRCSGVLIGPDTVATAAHCVHSGGSNGNFYPRNSYRIYPGADGANNPFGSCTAKSLHTVSGWTNSADERFDYAAIKLNCTVGDQVGWYGFTTARPKGQPAIIQGYPGDKPLTQWLSVDKVRQMDDHQVYYKNDTTGGMSGSPVWYDKNGPYLIGIHAYRTHGSGYHKRFNHGTRITQAVYDNLLSWASQP